MKITKEQLKQIIKEELEAVMDEGKFMDYNQAMDDIYGDEAMAQRFTDQSSKEEELAAAEAELQSLLDYAQEYSERFGGMPREVQDMHDELQARVARLRAELGT